MRSRVGGRHPCAGGRGARQRTGKALTWPHRRKARWKMAMNGRRLPLLAVTTLCALASTACAPKPLAVAVKPPTELLTCAADPVATDIGEPGIERDRQALASNRKSVV